ncbi:hypothetical protein GCM10023172_05130 [Hymenobacter ginsengisoli]|uniref:DUF6438 domain-containing protein n=1 Tax=Hymenobacter ginsengisoli TaxID=1051626 RepID=A0ABP8PYH0_9BACT|nr:MULTISPECIES: DUF6438 domain-containing protein [unclassified Hymenobacter]MBO2030615.1 hypothetical protein [Hymenobacter sp. BT559]
MRYLLWLLAFSLALPACAQRKLPRKAKPATAVATPKTQEPVLVYQRTPCYGRCPAYTATVYADGRVEYDGQRFVPLLGKHTLSLPPAQVADMLAEAKRINFSALADQYAGHTTDLPATLITVHPAGQPLHAVYASEGIPENLQGYIKYLNSRLDPLTGMSVEK